MVNNMKIRTVNEGKVNIKIPDFNKVSSKAPVFYNPAMELNRDLSVPQWVHLTRIGMQITPGT